MLSYRSNHNSTADSDRLWFFWINAVREDDDVDEDVADENDDYWCKNCFSFDAIFKTKGKYWVNDDFILRDI